MPALNVAVMMIGVAVAGLGLVGLAAPSQLLDFGRSLLTETGLYVVAAARVAFGLLLLLAARQSRMPRTLRVFGIVVIVAGLTTPLFGVERSVSMFDWLSAQAPALVRVMATFAVAFGTLVAYAAFPRRRSAV
ncbi:MAG TPA: hypothetical protein VH701_13580 [Vicinamibacterales bacterium]|jgi:hypothetical protein